MDVYYTIIKVKNKDRLKWYTYEPESQRAFVLDKTQKYLLLRHPAFRYAPGLISEYFKAKFIIGELLEGSFDAKFNFKEIFEIQYDIDSRKEAKRIALEKWEQQKTIA